MCKIKVEIECDNKYWLKELQTLVNSWRGLTIKKINNKLYATTTKFSTKKKGNKK